jgi:PAS domain S-box-containing protein
VTAAGADGRHDLLDALPMAVVVVDGGRISDWNEAAEVLYGHGADRVIGLDACDVLFEDEDRPAARALFDRIAGPGGESWEGDLRVRRKDGNLLVSSFRGARLEPGRFAWIATDGMDQGLAEQERAILLSAEHAAREMSEEALGLVEAILTSAPVGIAVFDLDLRYVRVNEAYADISGVPAEDHLGGRIGDVVPLPYEVGADLRRVVTTGRTILDRIVVLPDMERPDELRHFRVSYYPVRTTAGVLVGAGATVIEITEAKRSEAERAALLEQAEQAQRRLAILATASTVLASTMQIDDLLERLARVLTPGVADWCVIEAVGSTGAVEHVAVSHRDRTSAERLADFLRTNPIASRATGPVAAVLASGEARLFGPDTIGEALAEAASDRGQPDVATQFSLRTGIIVPIESRGQILGVIVLSTDGDRQLGVDDLDLAVEVAHRAALALGNARAFQQEHQIAESLQRSLLPAAVEAVEGLDLAVRYLAATDGASVGGDWYDVIRFDDGQVGVVVGDVVGHDLAASSAMGQLRSTLRAFAYEDHASPGGALARLDRLFDALGLSYATCVLGIVDPTTRRFQWSSAGHPPPLLLREGEARFLDDGGGALLGLSAGQHVGQSSMTLAEGDYLVLYTDGLVERRTESISVGLARLATAAVAAGATSAEALCTALLSSLFPPGSTREDDVAILVAKLTTPGDAAHQLLLTRGAESVREARRFVARTFAGAGWSSHRDIAELLVSEIATNAIRYGTPPYEVSIDFQGDCVEVGVTDDDPNLPRPVDPSADSLAESGRGLSLVAALASSWGTRARASGKTVWFTLERSPSGDGGDG